MRNANDLKSPLNKASCTVQCNYHIMITFDLFSVNEDAFKSLTSSMPQKMKQSAVKSKYLL